MSVTESQFMAVFGASALSQPAAAAGIPKVGTGGAPTASSATSSPEPANDNQETTATSTPDAIEPAPAEPAVVEDQPAEPAPLPEVQAANDNAPAADEMTAQEAANDNPPPPDTLTGTQ